MKPIIYLLRVFTFMLCLIAAAPAYSQEAKKAQKQNVQTKDAKQKPKKGGKKASATAQKKRAAEQKKKNATQKEKPVSQKKPVASKEKAVAAKPKGKRSNVGKKKPEAKKTERYIALKTNVPFMAVAVQNLALEVQLHEHISLDLPVMWSISDIEREHGLRTFALQPEARWWLKSVGTGHFVGVHTHLTWFNLKWNNDRYQTEKRPLMGVGVSYGYKLPLSAHWGAEFNIGAGYANMQYNTYYNIENGAKIGTSNRHYWGITRVGLSLVYRF